MKKIAWMALLLGLAIAAPLPISRAGEQHDVEKMIAEAKTAADHEAIAAHFEAKAKEARSNAEAHRKMAGAYARAGGALVEKWHMDHHCEAIARSYERAAEESEKLAAAHREMAKQAK